MTHEELLEEVERIHKSLMEPPWDPVCMGEAMRHLWRNVDHDQYHGSDDPHVCDVDYAPGFYKYDGNDLAKLRNLLPEIIQALQGKPE